MRIAAYHLQPFAEAPYMLLTLCAVAAFSGCGSGRIAVLAAASPSSVVITSIKGYTITAGGTYSGNFRSDDPNTPAVTIQTTDPVVLENATLTSRGDLIHIVSVGNHVGSNVTVRNVTGTALDPGVAGQYRGSFVKDEEGNTLSVTNCTMTGVSFGVYLAPNANALTSVTIDNNIAYNMEDRPSDGAGGLVASRLMKGHFIQLNTVTVTGGADIGWNQVIDTPGQASVEDIIDIAESSGSSIENPINIHDNYLEGAFSTGTSGYDYTGGGIMNEGSTTNFAQTNAFVLVTNNVVVHTANYGIGIAFGHDITETGNRVVSCGVDSTGAWYAGLSGVAIGLAAMIPTPYFYNNHVSGTTGGLIRPASMGGAPMSADYWTPGVSTAENNSFTSSAFDDPCWTSSGAVSNNAEAVERTKWNAKVQQAGEMLGDAHTTTSANQSKDLSREQ